MMAISRVEQMEFNFAMSACFAKCPVGLLGWTTMTPRVRGVMACSSA